MFVRLLEAKNSFIKSHVVTSVLFGLLDIAAPVRSLLDGEISPKGKMVTAIILVLTTGITGAKFCLLTKITGSLWMSMADHFFNKYIINLLHITTISGADQLQVIRISIAQTLSFLIVLIIYFKSGAGKKTTFRNEQLKRVRSNHGGTKMAKIAVLIGSPREMVIQKFLQMRLLMELKNRRTA